MVMAAAASVIMMVMGMTFAIACLGMVMMGMFVLMLIFMVMFVVMMAVVMDVFMAFIMCMLQSIFQLLII